jgi:hypothetical protein
MPHLPETTDPKAWARYFAMETNNRAWQLASQAIRSASESREMLDAAHASAYHWNIVGADLNRMRANYLVAEVHALLGFGASALALATEALSYFDDVEAPDWERAYLHVIHSHAAAAAGDAEIHAASYSLAQAALREVADPEERRVVEQTFVQVPEPMG